MNQAPSRTLRQATGTARLLDAWHTTGRPADLAAHLERHGAAPRPGAALIAAVEEAGLTGRGGAGFPTGRKMRVVAAQRRRAVFVANGMESEPASRKDQTLLAVAPHLVLDGAVLAAQAVGADRVHLCVPRTRTRQLRELAAAIDERRAAGLDSVPVVLQELPHGYVTSESTALVHWLNGGPARPLGAPPRTHERGVHGRPTLVQNVETLAHLALIARHGPHWFRQAGTADTPGTVLVSLGGAVRDPGVLEAEAGTTIGVLLEQAGGPTEPLQAVLVGGYAGTWLPADRALALPFTRSGLAPAEAAPGAGVITVLPRDTCPLTETARMLTYLAASGAQQCGPCRFGLPSVAADFTALADGHAGPDQVERLRHRVGLLPGRGACRHPDGAARLAAGALTAFADDVEHHLHRGPCRRPAVLPAPPTARIREWR
ncbi:NADH-ubiquinone oxidoreductase-F iron-sulfur binding region domain-containing protein [Kitasatospora sp. NPDC127059]|uniref:NADH-ubiquinone oxidoreductase-F iron-sulfur binding region domain-containing protein n=1 Tax=unclassified Kitasatospora TaxID=2633591 RepID=UPI00364F6384